jgi:hypothetical protein
MPKLAKDATIASVWPLLANKRKYAAPVRHQLELAAKKYGNSHVRIGITGSGLKPCYRLFWLEGTTEKVIGSYWDNHQPLDVDDAVTATASMSFEELDAFFREAFHIASPSSTKGS